LGHSAVLICAENSFWYQADRESFVATFRRSYQTYYETGTNEKVEVVLRDINELRTRTSKEKLFEIILDHRLGV